MQMAYGKMQQVGMPLVRHPDSDRYHLRGRVSSMAVSTLPHQAGIYSIVHTTTGRVYVGSSVNIAQRVAFHKWLLGANRHANKRIQNSWNKYGKDSFSFEVLEVVSDELILAEREQFWIDSLRAADRRLGFNILETAYSGVRPASQCLNCKRFIKPLRKGRCHACNEYLRRRGVERPYIEHGTKEKHAANMLKSCVRCQRPTGVVGYAGRGLCKSCYRTTRYR